MYTIVVMCTRTLVSLFLTQCTIIRFVQQEVTLRSFSAISLGSELDQAGGSRTNLELGSLDSLKFSNPQLQSALSLEARELIHFVASRDTHRPPWPFAGEGTTWFVFCLFCT